MTLYWCCAHQDSSIGKKLDLQSIDHWFEPHCQRGIFWYGPLANLSLQIASMAPEHHGRNNGGSNQ